MERDPLDGGDGDECVVRCLLHSRGWSGGGGSVRRGPVVAAEEEEEEMLCLSLAGWLACWLLAG